MGEIGGIPLWVIAAGAVILLILAAQSGGGSGQKDPRRMFTTAQREAIRRRAGGRCEHLYFGLFRCRNRGAEADHVYPHAKGGATSLVNGQWLCRMHNRAKSDHYPSQFYVSRLKASRKKYFPPGESTDIRPR